MRDFIIITSGMFGVKPQSNLAACYIKNVPQSGFLSSIQSNNMYCGIYFATETLQWRHNELAGVWNHQPRDCLLNRLFRRRSKKTSKFRVTGLCVGNSPGTGEFLVQMASNAENVSIW